MKKILLLLIFGFTIVSCGFKPNNLKVNDNQEPIQNIENLNYDIWNFSGNGKNEKNNNSTWETRNIEFKNGSLISDGIYENSGRFSSEKAFLQDSRENLAKHTIAIRFKCNHKFKKDENYLPILVKGRYYRCIKIYIIKDEIKISFNGNFYFSIPNEDISMKKLKINPNIFNSLYLSWDIEKSLIYISLNDNVPLTINIPKDFEWNKCGNKWTIQDYSNGTAFKGEIDYIIKANDFLNRKTIKSLIR